MSSAGVASQSGEACFYVRPHTLSLLADARQSKVILVGSFAGAWNFGDVLQLRGTLRWHRQRGSGIAIAVHGLPMLQSPIQFERLSAAFATDHWLFYSRGHADHQRRAQALGLVRLDGPIVGPTLVHAYGGGYFNRLWGAPGLQRIETVLAYTRPDCYVISGQQIGAEFAAALAAHCRQRSPALIGCRDEASLACLRQHGMHAEFSGDDALEELDLAADGAGAGSPSIGGDPALYLNTSDYVTPETDGLPTALRAINAGLETLARHCGPTAIPILIRAYAEDGPYIRDTLATVRATRFAELFPVSRVVDLVDLTMREQLASSVPLLRRCRLAVSTSYHVTLFMKVLGVPVYLFAFNDYYRQKKAALGDAPLSLEDFLALEPELIVSRQNDYVAGQRAQRAAWLQRFHAALPARAEGRIT